MKTSTLVAVGAVALSAAALWTALRYKRECFEATERARSARAISDDEIRALSEIAADYDLELDVIDSADWRSNATGFIEADRIGLYDFRDREQREAVFFHELGHHVSRLPPRSRWPFEGFDEAEAWRAGFDLADSHGYDVSPATKAFARESLLSYFNMPGEAHPDKHPSGDIASALQHAGLSLE